MKLFLHYLFISKASSLSPTQRQRLKTANKFILTKNFNQSCFYFLNSWKISQLVFYLLFNYFNLRKDPNINGGKLDRLSPILSVTPCFIATKCWSPYSSPCSNASLFYACKGKSLKKSYVSYKVWREICICDGLYLLTGGLIPNKVIP